MSKNISNYNNKNKNNVEMTDACDTSNSFKELKLVVVGDGYIGKTCMLWSFVYKKFPQGYVPTIFDIHSVKINHNNESYTLNLFDTAGQEDWDTLRKMAYPETDVIVLCFSVVRPDSFENITAKWIPELNKLIPTAKIVLVGTQVDLRDNKSAVTNDPSRTRSISAKEGEELKHRIRAFKYMECSAVTQHNIADVFSTCVDAVVFGKRESSCFQSLLKRFPFTKCMGKSSKTKYEMKSKTRLHQS